MKRSELDYEPPTREELWERDHPDAPDERIRPGMAERIGLFASR